MVDLQRLVKLITVALLIAAVINGIARHYEASALNMIGAALWARLTRW